jgi:replication factor C subunit 1
MHCSLFAPMHSTETTTATLVAQESGRHVLEFNASDVRSKKSLKEDVGDITGSRTLTFAKKKQSQSSNKRVIIMDEVDGLGAGDRGGLAELIQMIKGSRVPIICICNDRQSQKIKSLVPYCMDLKYARPRRPQIAARIVEIARMEGFTVEMNAAERLAESCGNDVRQCLNACQMWASENTGKRMSYGNLKEREKSISKDEMLRVSLFDATRLILQGREGLHGASPEAERAHFLKRNDAFFVDYNFTGLMVQQNYVAILKNPYSKAAAAKQTAEIEDVLERMALASEAMSDFALAEHKLRSDQNWSVLPFVGSLTVKTGYHAGGERGGFLVGYPEFTAWLGKNSSKSKKARMIQELQHHMNFRISGGSEEMRLSYLPVLRTRFLSLLKDKGSDRTSEIIELMDEYGLNRDDIIERFDEFKMDKKDKGFSILDSKQKTALTKAYNAGSHKSQALVIEQGGAKKSKRKATSLDELGDPDVVDDDKRAESEEEEEELDPKAAALLFKKKGRRTTAKAGAKKKAAPKRKK